MLVTTTAALLWEMLAPGSGYLTAKEPDWYLGGISLLLVLLELVVAGKCVVSMRAKKEHEGVAEDFGPQAEKTHHRMAL